MEILIDTILARIPPERHQDVVLIDPADEDYSIGFNILQAHSDTEKTILSSDLTSVFKRQSTSWGDQMTVVLSNAVLAFLESSRGGTLLDLRRFLTEARFRHDFLKTVTDQEVRYFWEYEFKLIKGTPQVSILTRLNNFLRPKTIRYMVAQKENRLDFADIMDSGKILLAKLPHGSIGEENSYLLGTLLVTKLYQIVMGRQNQEESLRRPFWLYLDEFHHFVTPSMASILAGARKYKLGLTLAHQNLRQLSSRDLEVESSVISNPYTRICFRLGDQDARKLSEGFSHFDATDLQNLGIGQAIARVERSDFDFNLDTELAPREPENGNENRSRIIELSRKTYALPRKEIEEQLTFQFPDPSPPPQISPEPIKPPPAKEKEPDNIVGYIAPQEDPEEEKEEEKPPEVEVVKTPVLPGRGSHDHKYLQEKIRRLAHGFGFIADTEGEDCDVLLTKHDGDLKIGIELALHNHPDYEIKNIRKALDRVKCRFVLVVSPKSRHLSNIDLKSKEAFSSKERERLRFYRPDNLIDFFHEINATEQTRDHRGYNVKTKYSQLSQEEQDARREIIFKNLNEQIKEGEDESDS